MQSFYNDAVTDSALRQQESVSMDFLYIFIGLFVVFIGLFKRELLIERETFRIVLRVSVLLFFIGVTLHFFQFGKQSSCGALVMPLISLGLFRVYRRVFLKVVKREPIDTFLNSQPGLGADMLFNFLYFVSSIFVGMFITLGMMEWERLAGS